MDGPSPHLGRGFAFPYWGRYVISPSRFAQTPSARAAKHIPDLRLHQYHMLLQMDSRSDPG